jgi:hypothetical protein
MRPLTTPAVDCTGGQSDRRQNGDAVAEPASTAGSDHRRRAGRTIDAAGRLADNRSVQQGAGQDAIAQAFKCKQYLVLADGNHQIGEAGMLHLPAANFKKTVISAAGSEIA